MEKPEILEGIHTLVSNNVIGSKQLMQRYKGFRGELFFEGMLKEKYPQFDLLDGGIIMSKDSSQSSLDNAIYYTIIDEGENIDNYLEVYQRLSLIGFERMFLVVFNENWSKKPIMIYKKETIFMNVPEFKILQFDLDQVAFNRTNNKLELITDFFYQFKERGRSKFPIAKSCKEWLVKNLNQFSREQLLKVYMNRLFFDGFVGFSKKKGKCSDIDLVLKHPDKSLRFIEIKEKDLPKRKKKGFGMDVPRINDLKRVEEVSGVPYHYVVRQVDNQKDRNLVNWKYIPMKIFHEDVKDDEVVEGGTGMRSANSKNPTHIGSFDLFSNL